MADKQKKFFDAPVYFNEQVWIEKGRLIMKAESDFVTEDKGRQARLNNYLGALKWAVGDWLCEGADSGIKPKKLKDEARRITGYKWGTLKNCMVVSRAIEPSRRRDDLLPYSFHVEVAKYAPEQQDEYLQMAVEKTVGWKKALSVRDFRKAIEEQKRSKMTVQERLASYKQPQPMVILKIRVSAETEMFLRAIARAKNLTSHTAQAALWWLATEYVKEHNDKLKAEVEADRAAWLAEQKKRVEENEARSKKNAESLAAMDEELAADVDNKIPSY